MSINLLCERKLMTVYTRGVTLVGVAPRGNGGQEGRVAATAASLGGSQSPAAPYGHSDVLCHLSILSCLLDSDRSHASTPAYFIFALSLTLPHSLLQFLSKKLGANPVVFGYMETLFAVSMLLGGPLFGRFGDIFGARAALLVAFLSSFLSYLVLSMASSIPELFLSRVFAFMMHAMHGRDIGTVERRGSCLNSV